MRKTVFIFIFFYLSVFGFSQSSNIRIANIEINKDTLALDSLSIIPSSFMILGDSINPEYYSLNWSESLLIIHNQDSFPKTILVKYKVFPINFSQKYYNKDSSLKRDTSPIIISYNQQKITDDDIFGFGDLQKQGSISRGFSVGNSQDLSVASNFDLKLSGNIYEDLQIQASISDNTIPIQPSGNTAQLQEFDRVYVKIFNNKYSLTAGDFNMKNPASNFMKYNKNVQGALINSSFKEDYKLDVYAGAAISKGQYSRNTIEAVEGNQGPYKLRGANNESFVIIIAGSEKVFIDGELQSRGQNNDYVIDYNTAEITFTAKNIITKDSRIVVEFEYSDKVYARSLTQAGLDFKKENLKLGFYFFDERDLKNQLIDANIGEKEKQILANVGDSIHQAVVPTVDSIGFYNDRVLYRLTDSLGYDSVFVYSTNPDLAVYEVRFSYVGAGNGNYKRIQSSANGKVFEWIAPQASLPQGDYEAVELLISPKNKQMSTMKVDYQISKSTEIKSEFSLSKTDLNLFSNKHDDNNIGFALKSEILNNRKFDNLKNWQLFTKAAFEMNSERFNPIERYRSVEFERDWNVNNLNNRKTLLYSLNFNIKNNKSNNYINYNFNGLSLNTTNAFRNHISSSLTNKKWHFNFDASLTQNNNDVNKSIFLRHRIHLSRNLGKIKIGIKEDAENNKFYKTNTDSLLQNSYSFQEYEAYLQAGKKEERGFIIQYVLRDDKLLSTNKLKKTSRASEFRTGIFLNKSKHSSLSANFVYRELQILDTNLSNKNSDKNSLGRLQHRLSIFKGAISTNTFYESGTGMEIKREYSYIEVAEGQGAYSWTDYNDNNIKELNEFEVAAFSDQANYLRVNIPTNEFIKTYTNSFNTSVKLMPYKIWKKSEKKFKKTLSKFDNTLNIRTSHKSTKQDINTVFNPFYNDIYNKSLRNLSYGIRNIFRFNSLGTKFGANFIYRQNSSKAILTNGYEIQRIEEFNFDIRWNISKSLLFNPSFGIGDKERESEFFENRSFNIDFYSVKPNLSYRIGKNFRLRFTFEKEQKQNKSAIAETAKINNYRFDIKYNILNKSALQLNASMVNIKYNANDNTALAFEMLNALKTGRNFLWMISYQRTVLNNLQLTLRYNGRKPSGNNVIHTGNIQLRAFF